MDFLINSAYAQAPAAAPSPMQPLLMMIIFVAVFYFLLIRPQMKRAKEHRNMVSQLAKGDEVITTGGLAGRIEHLGDSFISLEIAPEVKVKVQKSQVANVLPKGTLKAA